MIILANHKWWRDILLAGWIGAWAQTLPNMRYQWAQNKARHFETLKHLVNNFDLYASMGEVGQHENNVWGLPSGNLTYRASIELWNMDEHVSSTNDFPIKHGAFPQQLLKLQY